MEKKYKYEACLIETNEWEEIDELFYDALFLCSLQVFSKTWGKYYKARKVSI